MQYFNDFTQYPLSTKLDAGGYDWTRLAGDTDWTFQTVADARGASGVALHIQRSGTARPFAYWTWEEVPDVDAGELYLEFIAGTTANGVSACRSGFLAPTCSLNSDATAAYSGYDRGSSTSAMVPVVRVPATAYNSGVASGTAYTFEAERARKVLLQWSTSGSNVTINYKTWWSTDTEPTSWTVTTTQTTHPGLGAVGFSRILADAIQTRVLALGVGTGADSAPREPLSTPSDATADGGIGTGTGFGTGGDATGEPVSNATAEGGTGTGTGSGTGGDATVVTSGSFTSSPMYSSGILQASVALDWTWYPGAIGATPTGALVHGSGSTSATGTLTASGLSVGAGFLLAKTADGAIYYEAGTVA